MHGVVICGAGPVGLLLASELRLAGVEVTVVERLTAASQVVKAGSVGGQTALSFDQRGMLEAMLDAQSPEMKAMRGNPKAPVSETGMLAGGHFAGLWIVNHRDTETGHGGIPLPQVEIERVLERRARESGVVLRRGVAVADITANERGAVVTLENGEKLSAAWVVGCDGGRSLVRKCMKVRFDGTDATITGRQALVEMDDVTNLPPARQSRWQFGWNRLDGGMMVRGPFNRLLTVEFDGPPVDRDSDVTAAELEASVFRVAGVAVRVTKVLSATRWTDHARTASSYRDGRLFLAGDAAHVHSPFGGQGLNLGLQDAMNLGWKLAAVIGGAPESLLESYTSERKPAAERVLENTRAQIALMKPGQQVTALRDVFTAMASTPESSRRLSAMMAGTDVRYSVTCDHPLAGAMVRDRVLSDGTRLYATLRSGRGAIVDLTTDGVLTCQGRVPCVSATAVAGEAVRAIAVRPDGYVAWASDADDVSPTVLADVVAAWA